MTDRNPQTIEEARAFVARVEALFMPWDIPALLAGFTDDCVVRFGDMLEFRGKAALERLVEAWRAEHPDIGFTCLIVGECAGGEGDGQTGMNIGWDLELAMKAVPLWSSRGCMPGKLMPVEDLIEVVHTILGTNASTSMPVVVARGAPASPAAFVDSTQS